MTKTAAIVVGVVTAMACSAKDRASDATDGSAATGGSAGSGATPVGGAAGATGGATGGSGATAGTGAMGGGGASGADGSGCTPPVSGGVCDTFQQCGCPTGQNCLPNGSGITSCAPAGSVPAYGSCTAESCGAGMACVAYSCRPFCETSTDCEASRPCRPGYLANESPIPGVFICALPSPCDLAHPVTTGCVAGATCLPVANTSTTDCYTTTGTKSVGQTCLGWSDCAPGLFCSTTGVCARWCKTSSDCGGGPCVSFSPAVIYDTVEYKYCQ